MLQQRPRAPRSPDGGWRAAGWRSSGARLGLAACLLAIVAAGLRGAVAAPRLDGPYRHDGLLLGAVLEAVLFCLAVALGVRHRRAPRDARLAARLRKVLAYVVGAGLIAIPFLYLLSRPPQRTPRPVTVRPSPTLATPRPQVPHASAATFAVQVIILALVTALAAALILLAVRYLLQHRRPRSRWPRSAGGFPVPASDGDDEPGLREAVESGYSALRGLDDARAAIIACYLAMEDSLGRAGTPRGDADTPDELLARAAAQGLVRGGAAARLTALFYEARFSSHPMLPADRDDAEQALAELAGSLGGPAPAAASARPGAPDGAGG